MNEFPGCPECSHKIKKLELLSGVSRLSGTGATPDPPRSERHPLRNNFISAFLTSPMTVDKPEHYVHSSAREYYYQKNCGLLKVSFI